VVVAAPLPSGVRTLTTNAQVSDDVVADVFVC
jgi:hypothetical protein